MAPRPTFADLLAQPGSSDAPAAPPSGGVAGSVLLNKSADQIALSDPRQQARVRKEASLNALKGLGQQLAKQYETQLNADEESQFQNWKQQNAPNDSGEDYDLRGAYKAGVKPSAANGHWPDTFKKPNHPTFSNDSMYYKDAPDKAGRWEGEHFIPPGH